VRSISLSRSYPCIETKLWKENCEIICSVGYDVTNLDICFKIRLDLPITMAVHVLQVTASVRCLSCPAGSRSAYDLTTWWDITLQERKTPQWYRNWTSCLRKPEGVCDPSASPYDGVVANSTTFTHVYCKIITNM
jgi:hypothetical protein